ncbi:putative carbonic anhydrase 5 [Amphibalanus amphitrite]|uniref:carbonic anhydrase n=1 Tax=Amphibalanus amphitrite TaxID=1232801 RepID=A0A6A4WX09_AMPAM|nr:putative carbonic anhydrase 3 [Amphibalanus amphitrite]KAF0306978.1 putative carbonic anhydrase 5 [Amphibalanus amphitrite]
MPAARAVLLLSLAVAWCDASSCPLVPPHGLPWNYHDFDSWKDVPNSRCAEESRQQSPIDVYGEHCEDDFFKPWVRKNSDKWDVIVTNDGRTLKMMFDCFGQVADNGAHGPLTLISNVVEEEGYDYDLAEIHFHWDEHGEEGSEHAVEGERRAAEVHLKFKHIALAGVPFHVAREQEGALHALGILLTDDRHFHGHMHFPTFHLEKDMHHVRKYSSSYSKEIHIDELKDVLDTALENVYRYIGSLTTPPCTLGLPWLVATKPAKVSSSFLHQLRKLRDEHGHHMHRNHRPVQERRDELLICRHEG